MVGECVDYEPSSFEETVQQPVWVDAMVEEYDSIMWDYVLDVVPRPQDKSVVSSRWLYKVKQATDGSVEKHKARRTEGVKLQGFTDVDWAGSPSDKKSTSRGIFNLGSAIVSCYKMKQRSVALSIAEAKYMAASQAACEAICMRKILVGLFGQRMDHTMIYCDNQSCIKLFENPVFHDRSKHIDIWYHHLRDYVVKRIMLLLYVSTEEQNADILTKALSKCKFEFHRDRIRVTDNPFLVEREC
eukprot:PITA_05828